MKGLIALFVVTSFACLTHTAAAQGSNYQNAKILTVQKLPGSSGSSTGTDAPISAETDRYNVNIQLGDSVYTCRATAPGGSDLDWTQGKSVQAKVKGKAMYLKRSNGAVVKLSIVGKKTD